MDARFVHQIIADIQNVAGMYHRLVLVVAPVRAGKTSVLLAVKEQIGAPLINVSLELSKKLLDISEKQRPLQVRALLESLISQSSQSVVLLDNTEILFEPMLRQDPLQLLLGLSRARTIVASWIGKVQDGRLIYAAPDHPEYRHYPAPDLTIVHL